MIIVNYPCVFRGYGPHITSFFLAGGSTNWRKTLIDSLQGDDFCNSAIIDPFDEDYKPDINTRWEVRAIQKVDCVVFWFPKETIAPVSLFELGTVCRDNLKGLIVGIDPEYPKRDVLIEELKVLSPHINPVSSLDSVKQEMKHFIEVYNGDVYPSDPYSVSIGGTD